MLNRNNYQEVGGGDMEMWQKKSVDLEVGDSVEGVYVSKKEIMVNGVKKNIYVLEQKDGSEIGVWGSAVLDGRFENIQPGVAVGIEYLGKKKGKQPQPYNDFFVATENGEVDFLNSKSLI